MSLILVTGGARSGKSTYAQQLAESLPAPRLYLATCPRLDAELDQRIQRHQRQRAGRGWRTVEEELDLAGAVERARGHATVLVDCLTLWVNNLLYRAEATGGSLGEEELAALCEGLAQTCAAHPGSVILVTNEVGWGIVPENALARRFRDIAGRANQVLAAAAAQVILVCCGIPLHLRGGPAPEPGADPQT